MVSPFIAELYIDKSNIIDSSMDRSGSLPRLCGGSILKHYPAMEQTEPTRDPARTRGDIPTVSRCLSDGTVIELLHDLEARTTAFAVWTNGRWTIEREVTIAGEV